MHPRPLTLALAVASIASPLLAQTSAPSPATQVARALDAKVLKTHLEFLADDALEGRAPGTRGGKLAAKYIAAQFERLGLEPVGDSGTYFQRVPIIALTPEPTLAVQGASAAPLAWKKDFVMWSMRNDSLVNARGDVVFAGYGIVAPNTGGTTTRGSTPRARSWWSWSMTPASRTRPSSAGRSSRTTDGGRTRSRRRSGRARPAF